MLEEKYFKKYMDFVDESVFQQLLQKYVSSDIIFEPIGDQFTESDKEQFCALIDESTFLAPQEKMEAIIGLMMILDGSIPEPAILSHLEKVAGKEFVETIKAKQKELGSGKIASKKNKIDVSPRRIFFGATIPGKKMTAILEPYLASKTRFERGQFLLDLYKDTLNRCLMCVALSLAILPNKGTRFGPAFRDIVKGKQWPSVSLYGAILTDIRDFLKFRFRATGLTDIDDRAVLESLKTGVLPVNVHTYKPDQVIQYTISSLDLLSRETEFNSIENMTTAMGKLIALLKETAELVMGPNEKQAWDDLFKYCQE